MREELDAQVLERALPDPSHQVGLGIGGHRIDHSRRQERGDDHIQRSDIVVADPDTGRRLAFFRGREDLSLVWAPPRAKTLAERPYPPAGQRVSELASNRFL